MPFRKHDLAAAFLDALGQQRIDVAKDETLKNILAHNRDEEKEHASMIMEWIRRKDPRFDKELRDYLFTDKPIVDLENTNQG